MPLFGLFKKRSQSKPSHIFDETKLSTLIRDHDQKTAQSADTPISTNYHLTPINNGNIEHLDHFPYTPSVNNSNHSNSAISVCDNDTDIFTYQHNDSMDSICPTLLSHGYQQIKVIRNLSQGQLIEIRSLKNPFEPMVVKKVSKNLYWNKITKSDEDGVHDMVEKNIIKEALLLHHCTVANKPPAPAICQYIDFFYDTKYYYLVMEYAGNITLADWCDKAFEYINKGKLDIEHYKQMVQYIFWQITALIYWLHHDMNICHLAITMEQIMVENCDFIECENGKMKINDGIVIKLCDFGLAQLFTTDKCISSAHVGKTKYKSPEVINKNGYMAKMNDVWCMGVCLLILITGHPMWTKACVNDELFVYFMNGYMMEMLKGWNIAHYFDNDLLCIIDAIFKYESQRVDINVLKQWINKLEI
eukprot:59251_1